jgi:uncharacterized membrane protein
VATAAKSNRTTESSARLIVMLGAGLVVAVLVGILIDWEYAPTSGWAAACLIYVAWVWLKVGGYDEKKTEKHARLEDPASGISELLVLIASVASLVAVVILILGAKDAKGMAAVLIPILALVSVALSWGLIHTLFALRYARLYFAGTPGGIDFNQDDPPRYVDFAYVAFTLGMTYQVSDTSLSTYPIRATALRQALLGYLFGAVILAATINLVAGLAN